MEIKMKTVCMIPARLGSSRVKKKNLRLINGKPLISYIIDTVKQCDCFDEIYLNSEALIFKEIADQHSISFYKRPDEYATDQSTNDEFALDFIENISGEILIQVLPTSPLISADEINAFVREILRENYDTLISVENKQIACVYENEPVNYDKLKVNPPSQTMKPVQAYATVLMGWKYETFRKDMERYGSAYHGGAGRTGYFELRGLSTIDIDQEADFLLTEKIMMSQNSKVDRGIEYYDDKSCEHVEVDVESILEKDGLRRNDLYNANREIINVSEIINENGRSAPWSRRVIETESNSATILAQLPGEGNRRHYHPAWNEWWYIIEGEWEWEIEGEKKIVKKGDIVFMKKGRVHKITAVGKELAIRLAVSRADVAHVYPGESNV
jgi:CMP-N-acetylneuraminic acid synthetase/quercetin dioxygenase-like cupin family protein